MPRTTGAALVLSALVAFGVSVAVAREAERPNIVFILADDMGTGDLGCYNPESKVPTPNMDRLAAGGMRFTDMHSPSAVCTPTRYGVLTGRYAWRTRLKSGVLWGYSPNLIEPGRVTVAELLRDHGYATACIGKWHLGLGDAERTDYSRPLRPGPLDHGFDFFFGIPASLDIEPYVWVENDRVLEAPTGQIAASKPRRGGGEGFWRGGPIAPGFRHADVLPMITRKAVEYIEERKGSEVPFFLYFPLTAPHTPWLPAEEFRGKSGAGPYGDFTAQVDWTVGRVLDALERAGVAERTLVILTSDNGAHWTPADIEKYGHRANHRLRGQKADIWEGGHRVPFIARWPGRVPAGMVSDRLGCLTDFWATAASIVGAAVPGRAAEDSFDLLPVLVPSSQTGDGNPPVAREAVVNHSANGTFAIRRGSMKLILGRGSGGFSNPRTIKPGPGEPTGQLYDLAEDPAETVNLYGDRPEVVEELTALLDDYRERGASHPRRSTRPPNIVLVLADDLGWADLGCYGNRFNETPHIDRLAAEGMRFTDAYAAAPVCSPTRAALQSGQHPARLGLTNFIPGHWRPFERVVEPPNAPHLPLDVVTIAESLRAAGYRTAHFGKWHLGGRSHHPDRQGYDVSIVTGGRHFSPHFRTTPRVDVEAGTSLAEFLTERTVHFMSKHRDRPFFVHLSHYAVHIPLEGREKLVRAYRARAPVDGYPSNPFYAALLEEIDRSVGRLVAALDELDLARDTMLIFHSDNGGLARWYIGGGEVATSNAPLRGEKGSLHEGGLRVPLIVRWPGRVRARSVSHEPVSTIDLYPTALEAAGIPRGGLRLDGVSLLGVLTESGGAEREALFWHYPHYHHSRPASAVRVGRFKLIEFLDGGPNELFDLVADIGKSRNLVTERPELARSLRERLRTWRRDVDAAMPSRNARFDRTRAHEWWSRRSGQPVDIGRMNRNYRRPEAARSF